MLFSVAQVSLAALQLYITLFKNLVGYHFDNLPGLIVAKYFLSGQLNQLLLIFYYIAEKPEHPSKVPQMAIIRCFYCSGKSEQRRAHHQNCIF